MKNYIKLEQKVIETLKAKGDPSPYQTRYSSLKVQSSFTGLACIIMLLTYGFLKIGSGQENLEMWTFPMFILLQMVTFTSRKRMQAINHLEREQQVES